MGTELLNLMADILFNILESVEERGGNRGGTRTILDPVAQVFFGGVRQPAIGVIDDHEFLGVQQVVGNEEGTESIISDNAAGISNDVGIGGLQAQRQDR